MLLNYRVTTRALSQKLVVAYINGMGASAVYWIASQVTHIFINSASTGYAGSLSVLCTSINQADFLQKQGVKVEILRSTRAVDKARINPVEAMDDAVRFGAGRPRPDWRNLHCRC